MEIPKPTEADKEYFKSLLSDNPEIEVKPMFGNLGAFVHGNMFAGLFGAAVGVRLTDADRDELAAVDGAGPVGPSERPMGGYVSLPPTWRADPSLAADWVGRALSHVSAMPTKTPKPGKASAKSPGPRAR
jgi:TfoX/Sxy family transcriptional regulator of competence genes